ncbi:hypothetical protein LIA77_08626 [Sarocladium implicatum]|nr:hypothetical protein LIA77_08626 [Sarocladium implicatum]
MLKRPCRESLTMTLAGRCLQACKHSKPSNRRWTSSLPLRDRAPNLRLSLHRLSLHTMHPVPIDDQSSAILTFIPWQRIVLECPGSLDPFLHPSPALCPIYRSGTWPRDGSCLWARGDQENALWAPVDMWCKVTYSTRC